MERKFLTPSFLRARNANCRDCEWLKTQEGIKEGINIFYHSAHHRYPLMLAVHVSTLLAIFDFCVEKLDEISYSQLSELVCVFCKKLDKKVK